jgi:hypothetical protein
VIEKEASLPPVERIWVGDRGYWIEKHGEPAGDGTQKFLVWSPEGELLSMIWGRTPLSAPPKVRLGHPNCDAAAVKPRAELMTADNSPSRSLVIADASALARD